MTGPWRGVWGRGARTWRLRLGGGRLGPGFPQVAPGRAENFRNTAAPGIPCPPCGDAGNQSAPTSPAASCLLSGGRGSTLTCPGKNDVIPKHARPLAGGGGVSGESKLHPTVSLGQPAFRRRSPCPARRRKRAGPPLGSPRGPPHPRPTPIRDPQPRSATPHRRLPPPAPGRTALSCPGRAPRRCIRARGQGARAAGHASQAARRPPGMPAPPRPVPRPENARVGPPTRPARPPGVRAPPPRPPARVPNKLAPSTRGPAPCKTPTEAPGAQPRPRHSGRPTSWVPGRGSWGPSRRRAPDTHLTIEFRAGGAWLPGPRLLPAWAFCCRSCPSRPLPPPHPPPPPLLVRQGAPRRRGGPAGCGGRRSWRRKSGRRALMARALQPGGSERAGARDSGSSRHAEMRLQSTEARRRQVPPETAGRGRGGERTPNRSTGSGR